MLRQFICLLVLCLPFCASAQVKLIAGKNYKTISHAETQLPGSGKLLVQEFFSYGCPWCYRIEPYVEKWRKHKANNVVFKRVPVVFERGWQYYARAYYTARALDTLDKITPKIFKAIHKDKRDLTKYSAMQNFFARQGVKKEEFAKLFNESPTINLEMKQGVHLMAAYHVAAVPTFVINAKYRTNLGMAKGDPKKLMAIVKALIAKAQSKAKTKQKG